MPFCDSPHAGGRIALEDEDMELALFYKLTFGKVNKCMWPNAQMHVQHEMFAAQSTVILLSDLVIYFGKEF